jgi:hypothetical protein
MITSTDIICYQISPEIIFHFIKLIEKEVAEGLSIGTAKL